MSKVVKTRVRCAVSGQETGCRPDIFDKRVEKYGSVEAMNAQYVSSASKRLLREGKTVEEIREGLSDSVLATLPTPAELETIVSAIVAKKSTGTKRSKATKAVEEPADSNDELDPDVAAFLEEGKETISE